MAKLTDDGIIALLSPYIDKSKKYQENLSKERERFYRIYRAEKYGNETPKWSQTVHPTVMTAVEWLKPGLVEVFTGDFFNFNPIKKEVPSPVPGLIAPQQQMAGQVHGQMGGQPQNPGKAQPDPAAESAKRIKKYIRQKLFHQLDGEQIIEDVIHNCLVHHYGIVKVCHRDDYDVETEYLERTSFDELQMLQADKNVIEVRGGEEVVELDPITQMPIWNGVQGATIVRKKQIYNGFSVEVIPPWELYFLPGYDTLEKNPFVAHVVRRSLDYIKRQELAGVYRKGTFEKVKARVDERSELPETAAETQALDDVDNQETADAIGRDSSTEKQTLAANEVWLWECYCKLDMKGDGLLQPHIVTICEDVVLREPIKNPYGSAPFELGYIMKEPHKILGRPMPQLLEDRQKVMSNLLRFIQDSAARSTYGGYLTSSHQTKLLLQRMGPGDVAWAQDINSVKELQPSAPSQFIFEAFNLTKQEIAAESGVNENMQGLDDNSLNKTAAGMSMRMSAGMQRQKLYARRIARMFKRVLRRILDIMRMWPPQDDVEMIGADVMIQPDDLMGQYSVEIEVGVGPQDRMAQAQILEQFLVLMAQLGLPQGMTDKKRFVAAVKAKNEYMDMDVSEYLASDEEMDANDQQQQQLQQMDQVIQQLQGQIQQMGHDMQGLQQQSGKLAQENQMLKSQPPEDKSLEVAELRLKGEIEAAKIEIEREKLALEREKMILDAEMKARTAENAREMAFYKQNSVNFTSQAQDAGKNGR